MNAVRLGDSAAQWVWRNVREPGRRDGRGSRLAGVWLLAHLGCNGGVSPTSPTAPANTVLLPGDYQLHLVAVPEASGCSGATSAPVLDGAIRLRLEATGGATLLASMPPGEGDLTIRFIESGRTVPGFASVTGTAQGVARVVRSAGGSSQSVRLSGSQLQGTAVPSGGSGDLVGPIVFITPGAADVSCTSARWSMGRVQS